MNSHPEYFTEDQQKVLKSIRIERILLPIIIGLAVVAYLLWRQFDMEEFRRIEWTDHALFWIAAAILFYVLRHLFYAWRLKVLSSDDFSWSKSIELIFIWEFASSVSPTSLGGSAVALFLLAQEKLSSARTVAVVLYSVVIDTLFFVISIPLLFVFFGVRMIRPGMENLGDLDGFGWTFASVLFFMLIYGLLFFYGLFINAVHLKRFLLWLSKRKILRRFRSSLRETAMDIEHTSAEMANKKWPFHLKVLLSTSGAWITRFLAINCIIIALVSTTPLDFWTQLLLYSRGESMYAITAFSPTPGGSGVAEIVFGGFYSDYIGRSASFLAALIWRLITYYPYLIIGVIIIPNWIRKIINRRKRDR